MLLKEDFQESITWYFKKTSGTEIFGRIEEGSEIDTKVIIFDFSGNTMYQKEIIEP